MADRHTTTPADTQAGSLLTGVVLEIHIVPEAGADAIPQREVVAVADRGLLGDRYYHGTGRYSAKQTSDNDNYAASPCPVPPKRQITFIAQEDLNDLASEQVKLSPAESRRNILTRGVELPKLIGRRFSVGEAVCAGVEDCTPCAYLESLTRSGVMRALTRRGGLRARILTGGIIKSGDRIVDLGPAPAAAPAENPD